MYPPNGPLEQPNQFAVVSPPVRGPVPSLFSSFKFTAGGGLVAGIVIGFVMIAGSKGGDVARAESSEPEITSISEKEEEVVTPEKTDVVSAIPDVAAVDVEPASNDTVPSPETTDALESDTDKTAELAIPVPVAPKPSKPAAGVELKIQFAVSPNSLENIVQIEVDGELATDGYFTLSLVPEKMDKRITITATADGYRKFELKKRVREGDTLVLIEMREKSSSRPISSADSSTKPSRPKKPKPKPKTKTKKKKKKRPGSLISL